MMQANLIAPYNIQLQEVPEPEITDDEIKIKINTFGICGSDIQMYHGLHKYMTYPVVIGHEVGGEIVEIGQNVMGFAKGEPVTVEPQIICHKCYSCKTGHFNVCEDLKVLGVHKNGMACHYFAIHPWHIHKCPSSMNSDMGALVEPLAVGIGAVKRARDYKDANIVVVGAGTIGNFTAQAAQTLGARRVMITDISNEKLAIARKSGLTCAVNTENISLKTAIIQNMGMEKADIIIDCAATKSSFKSIMEAARPRSKIVITGNYKQEMMLELPILQRQEIEMIGHMMYVKDDFKDAIHFLSHGIVTVSHIVSEIFPLRQIKEAFQYIDAHASTVMKVLIKMD